MDGFGSNVTQMIPVILMIDGTGVWRLGGGTKDMITSAENEKKIMDEHTKQKTKNKVNEWDFFECTKIIAAWLKN